MQHCFAGVTSVKMSALETQMIAAKQKGKRTCFNAFVWTTNILFSPGMVTMKPSVKSAAVTSHFLDQISRGASHYSFSALKKKKKRIHGCLEKLQRGVCGGSMSILDCLIVILCVCVCDIFLSFLFISIFFLHLKRGWGISPPPTPATHPP